MKPIVFFCLFLPLLSFARIDSTGLKIMSNDQVFIVHQVDKGQGLYSIAKKYKVETKDILNYNPDVEANGLKLDQYIFIPTKLTKAEAEKIIADAEKRKTEIANGTYKPTSREDNVVYYTVKPGETLFSISRLEQCKFTIAEIKKWNNLKENSLATGQKLIIAFRRNVQVNPVDSLTADDINKIVEGPKATKNTAKKDTTVKKIPKVVEWSDIREEGIATWIPDGSDISGKSYALYDNAPVGTVIRVVNLDNDKVTYVRVIGKMSKSDKKDVVLVLTESAAKNLEVKDKFFRVELVYSNDEL